MSNNEIKSKSILLIGPMCTGKSTLANKLHQSTNLPVIHIDEFRWSFLESNGYSREEEERIRHEKGFEGVFEYWRSFEFKLIEHVLSTIQEPSIIDFGAGQTIYEGKMLTDAIKIFEGFKNIYLILPDENVEKTNSILKKRLEHREYDIKKRRGQQHRHNYKKGRMFFELIQKFRIIVEKVHMESTHRAKVNEEQIRINKMFVESESNKTIATHIIYTNEANFSEVCNAISDFYYGRDVNTSVTIKENPYKQNSNKGLLSECDPEMVYNMIYEGEACILEQKATEMFELEDKGESREIVEEVAKRVAPEAQETNMFLER